MEHLVAYADGRQCRRTEAHLARCATCVQVVALLFTSIKAANSSCEQPAIADRLSDVFKKLDFQMSAWRAQKVLPLAMHPAATAQPSARLLRVVELYFGKKVASRVERAAGASEINAPAFSVSLFEAFLGRKAAIAITDQISGTAAF
jgi:hypothetical protein